MTAKEYLSQAYRIECEIRARQAEIAAMRSALHGRSVRYEGIGGRPADNTLEKAICRVIDRERELDREIARLVAMKDEIAAVLHKVPDAKLRELLARRYLDFQKWGRIAEGLGLTDIRWVFRLHDRALREVSKIINFL